MFEEIYTKESRRDWNAETIDPKSLTGYVPPGTKLVCPAGGKPYPPFNVFHGPVCPGGHQGGCLTNPSYADFIKFMRLSIETDTVAVVSNGANSVSIAERRLCARVATRFYDLNPSETKQTVAKLLRDQDFLVRSYAVESLEFVDHEFAVECLRQALKDSEPVVCSAAAGTCAKTNAKELIPELIQNLSSNDPKVRGACVGALHQMTGQSFGMDADGWRQWLKSEK